MKTHTQTYKDNLVKLGKEIDAKVTYTINGVTTELGADELSSVNPHYEGAILKSVMKQVDIESDVDIPINTEINVQFGVKYEDEPYEYIDFGNYIIYSSEKQEDTKKFRIVAYDKMLYSMKEYESLNVTYPITIRNYINAICTKIGLTFANASDTFANYNQTIPEDLFEGLGYTYRDVLDELAQATASTICINEDDELEVRYINDTEGKNLANINNIVIGKSWCNANNTNRATIIWIPLETNTNYSLVSSYTNTHITNIRFVLNYGPSDIVSNSVRTSFPTNSGNYTYASIEVLADTTFTKDMLEGVKIMLCEGSATLDDYEPYGDTINEDYIKNTKAEFGEKYGPVNSIVLSRGAEADNVYIRDEASVAQNGLCEIKIVDNQILSKNNRSDYLPDLLAKLDGLEYYTNDYESIGITYLDLCDRYNVKVDDNYYSCIMFNDEIEIKDGLNEIIYTEKPKETVTDYTKADKTDQKIIRTNLEVDKQANQITAIIGTDTENFSSLTELKLDIDGVDSKVEKNYNFVRELEDSGSLNVTNIIEDGIVNLSITGDVVSNSNLVLHITNNNPSNVTLPTKTILRYDDQYYDTLSIESVYNEDKSEYEWHVFKKQMVDYIDQVRTPKSLNNNYLLDEQYAVLNTESGEGIQLEDYYDTKEDLGVINIKLQEGEHTFSINGTNDLNYYLQYVIMNEVTNRYATEATMNSSITQTAEEINLEVSRKVGNDEVISKINQSAEQITIDANKVSLAGKEINLTSDDITIDSTNFSVDATGNMTCNNAEIVGQIKAGSSIEITASNDDISKFKINNSNDSTAYITMNGQSLSFFKDNIRRIYLTELTTNATLNMMSSNGTTSAVFSSAGSSNTSDIRFKRNIKKIDSSDSIDIIKNLNPIEFNYVKETEKHRGLSAQEVEKVYNEHGVVDEVYSINEEGKYMLNYTEFIPDLINCIKYQQKQIEDLQKQISILKEEK